MAGLGLLQVAYIRLILAQMPEKHLLSGTKTYRRRQALLLIQATIAFVPLAGQDLPAD